VLMLSYAQEEEYLRNSEESENSQREREISGGHSLPLPRNQGSGAKERREEIKRERKILRMARSEVLDTKRFQKKSSEGGKEAGTHKNPNEITSVEDEPMEGPVKGPCSEKRPRNGLPKAYLWNPEKIVGILKESWGVGEMEESS